MRKNAIETLYNGPGWANEFSLAWCRNVTNPAQVKCIKDANAQQIIRPLPAEIVGSCILGNQ
jgi:hypothetical protein